MTARARTELDGQDATDRDLVRALLRGAAPDDLAWATRREPAEVLRLVRASVLAGAPPPEGVDAADRRRIADYLLNLQSPGQAAGTVERLERFPEALDWARELRSGLAELYPDEPPPLPGADEEAPPHHGHRVDPVGKVRRQRETRRQRHDLVEGQKAAAIAVGPFRDKAVREHGERQERIKLPHYASRPVRIALYGLLAVLVAGLALCSLVSVPVYTSAKVLVVDLPTEVPGAAGGGLAIVALFPTDVRGSLNVGRTLTVQLPDTDDRVSTRIRFVDPATRGPREIADRYALPEPQSRRVQRPHVVAIAALETPDDAPPRSSFEGAVTAEAEARTGSERIIGLPF